MLFDGFQYMIYEPGDEFINIDSILINDPLLNFIYPNSQTLNLFLRWNLYFHLTLILTYQSQNFLRLYLVA